MTERAPIPFEIREQTDQHGQRVVVAANGPPDEPGTQVLLLLDPAGTVVRRRALKGVALTPNAEVAVPMLNALATAIIRNPAMPPEQVQAQLLTIASLIPTTKPTPVEWCMATIDGVRVYLDGRNVVVTRQDLRP